MDSFGLSDFWFLPSLVTRAPVPEDLGSVQTIDAKAEVAPASVGLAHEAVEEIWDSALRWYRTGIHPAISICIRVRGEIVLKRSIGLSHGGGPDEIPGTPNVEVTPDTPFNVFSASKPMAAMVIHLLDQRHLLHLDDPVCEYIPEFVEHKKEWVTIRHVLTHRAGIPVIPDAALDLAYLEDIDNAEAIRLLCESRPISRAGGRLAYHAVTGGFLIGEIVRRITGKNIRDVVDEEFCKPLGWRWMNFGVKRRDVEQVATSYFTGLPLVPPMGAIVRRVLGIDFEEAVRLSNDPRYLMGVLPAANLIATADELCEFYQLLLNGGTLRGERIFEPRTVWRATSEQSYGELDFTLGVPLRYGMGFMLGGEWLSLYGFDSAHAFGHLGLTNIVGWADPQRHLTCAIMTSGKPVFYPEMHRGGMLVYTIASHCPKDESVPPRPREEARSRTGRDAVAGTAKKKGEGQRRAKRRAKREKDAKKPKKKPKKKASAR
ncbi:MAG TPA: serine hydrolase domain-containing protein [Candidatus Binatia bacterium]|jgi:CubicO group peptidase (beta-lactamase class C family)